MLYLLFIFLTFAWCSVSDKVEFLKFISKYDRTYSSQEFGVRYAIFQENLKKINQMNQLSKNARFDVNQFADLSAEEFRSIYLSYKARPTQFDTMPVSSQVGAIPTNFDWRSRSGVLTPVKDQGQCGSCWAFSATENVESMWALSGKTLVVLSEQQLVDCSQSFGNEGCNGGLMDSAFQYLISVGGQETESAYPYTASDGYCQFSKSKIAAKISNYTDLSHDEGQMATWLYNNGPVSIAVDASSWQFYVAGILADVPCGTELDHGVLLTGYGSEVDMFGFNIDYWIIRNSWSASWGESGYIRIQRGIGMCGVNLDPSSSIV